MRYCWSLVWIGLAACSGSTTQSLLDADFLISGRSAVKLSSPGNGNTVYNESALVFSWQDIPGIGRYNIEIADSADFSNVVISKSLTTNEYVFQRADLKSGATFGSATYYWRASIPSSKNSLRSDVWTVNFIADSVLYVDCAYTGTGYGTRLAPYKSIQTGLDAALGIRAGTTNSYEVRVAKGTCNESIILRANVALKGGYDPTQNWARNPAQYQSIINTNNAIAISGFSDLTSAFTATLVEGFKIQTTNTGTTVLNSVSLSGATVTFKNNSFVYSTVTAATGVGIALMQATGNSNVTLSSNIFSATSSSATIGQILEALMFDGATINMNNNIFYAAGSGLAITVIYGNITGALNNTLNATNNVFFVSSSAGPNATNLLAMNTGGSGVFTGTLERNVFYLLGNSNQNRCGQQTNPTYFTSFKNNAMVDCNHSTNGFWYVYNTNMETGYPVTAGSWSAAANAASTGVPLDTVATKGLANSTAATNPVNCAGTCAALSGNRGGNTIPGTPTLPGNPSVVFQGYVAATPTTFAFKPNAIADMDNNGSYDASIDAGANTATTGLIALP